MMYRQLPYIFVFIFMTFFPFYALSQKKELAIARANLKAGSNLAQTEESMRTLLKDSANRQNHKIWLTLGEAIKKQYDEGNEKLYLKQQYDTAQLFTIASKLFAVYEAFDSIDAYPDDKGRVRPRFRSRHADMLMGYRKNIFSGGIFFMKKQRYSEAYAMFDTYLTTATHPLFTAHTEIKQDTIMPHAAAMAVFCAYKMSDWTKLEQYKVLSLTDADCLDKTLMWLSEAAKVQNDTTEYENLLQKGFERSPLNKYFFGNLFTFYLGRNKIDDADTIVERSLKIKPQSRIFRFSKTAVLLYQQKYDECIKICDQLIAENDTLSAPYLNAGLAYYRSAKPFVKSTLNSQYNKSRIQQLYKSALPYLERFKTLRPDAADLWALPLYHIYLTLNKGQEFEEIDALIKNNPSLLQDESK